MVTARRPKRSTAATVKSLDAALKRAQDKRYGKQPKTCTLPQPDGWECIREDAHEPPCARTPTRDLPVIDEALQAKYNRALDLLNALVPLVPPTAFAWPPAQDALREAQAMLVEEGRVKPSRNTDVIDAWLASKERG